MAKTAPYFHDGSAKTLEEAVRFMASGANKAAPGRMPLFENRHLSDAEVGQLVAFLESLTCTDKLDVIGDQSVPSLH